MRRNYAHLNLVELERQELREILHQELEAVKFASQETTPITSNSIATRNGKLKSRLASAPVAGSTTTATCGMTKKLVFTHKEKSNGQAGIEPHRVALEEPAKVRLLQLQKKQVRMHAFAEATANASSCWDVESEMHALNMLMCPDEFHHERLVAHGGVPTQGVDPNSHLLNNEEMVVIKRGTCASKTTPWQDDDIGAYLHKSCQRPRAFRKVQATGVCNNTLNSSLSSFGSSSSSSNNNNTSDVSACLKRPPVRIMIQSV